MDILFFFQYPKPEFHTTSYGYFKKTAFSGLTLHIPIGLHSDAYQTGVEFVCVFFQMNQVYDFHS